MNHDLISRSALKDEVKKLNEMLPNLTDEKDKQSVRFAINILQELIDNAPTVEENDKDWERNKKYFKGLAWANRLIDNAPAVEAFTKDEYEGAYLRGYVDSAKLNETPKGEWLLRNSGCIQWIRCSVCNKHQHYKDTSNFCPNCGARMGDDNK